MIRPLRSRIWDYFVSTYIFYLSKSLLRSELKENNSPVKKPLSGKVRASGPWPVHETSALIASASSERSGESVYMRRLARAFAARIHKVYI